jgi:hypothetical protein
MSITRIIISNFIGIIVIALIMSIYRSHHHSRHHCRHQQGWDHKDHKKIPTRSPQQHKFKRDHQKMTSITNQSVFTGILTDW